MEHSQKMNILLIEDSKLSAYTLKQLIEKTSALSLNLIHRSSMRYALEFLKNEKEPVALILLDLGLPDTSSDEDSFAQIKKAAPDIPVVILTGRRDLDFANSMVMKGAQDYINKDEMGTNPDLLIKTIQFALSRNHIQQKIATQIDEKDKTISWMSGDYSVEPPPSKNTK